ncbi:MAG: hypothetical protein EOO68_08940, partial [Moraxellaceae bacterium]
MPQHTHKSASKDTLKDTLSDSGAPYQPRRRTRWQLFSDAIKPRSTAMRTTVLVSVVVFFS